MNIARIYRPVGCRLLVLALTAAVVHAASGMSLGDPTFGVLKTRTATYTNVTVTTKAEKYIFITHASGMTSLKITDLPEEVRRQLGYAVTNVASLQGPHDPGKVAARQLTEVNQDLKPLQDTLRQRWQFTRPALHVNSEVLYTLMAILLLFYFGFCYCCHLICFKAKSPNSFLVWVPGLQMIPLLRAAGMSAWWFLAFLIPLLNIAAQVLWSLNIVKARGKHVVWAILLMLPLTGLVAFLYLAFSDSAAAGIASTRTSSKFQAKPLQATGRAI